MRRILSASQECINTPKTSLSISVAARLVLRIADGITNAFHQVKYSPSSPSCDSRALTVIECVRAAFSMAEQNYGLIREGTSRAVLKQIPIPAVRDTYIVVKTEAVALNPTDWTSLDAVGNDGVLNGCDYAGVVVAAGSKVTRFKTGDRVAGFSHGGTSRIYRRKDCKLLHETKSNGSE